jgi:hypothetical protein
MAPSAKRLKTWQGQIHGGQSHRKWLARRPNCQHWPAHHSSKSTAGGRNLIGLSALGLYQMTVDEATSFDNRVAV